MGAGPYCVCCSLRDRDESQVPTKPSGTSARSLSGRGQRCHNPDSWHWVSDDWSDETAPQPPLPKASSLPQRDGGYDWILSGKGLECGDLRRGCAEETMKVCEARGYELEDGKTRQLQSVVAMVKGTRLLSLLEISRELASLDAAAERNSMLRLSMAPEPCALQAALACAERGQRAALLLPASNQHPGEGFRDGSCHGLEEFACVRSGLALSLQRGLWLSRERLRNGSETPVQSDEDQLSSLPEDGLILSPAVEFFRGSHDTGYRLLPQAQALTAVVCFSLPRCKDKDSEEHHAALLTKLRAALCAARLAGATVAVLPSLGAEVGKALGEAVCWPAACGGEGQLEEVLLAGSTEALASAQAEVGW